IGGCNSKPSIHEAPNEKPPRERKTTSPTAPQTLTKKSTDPRGPAQRTPQTNPPPTPNVSPKPTASLKVASKKPSTASRLGTRPPAVDRRGWQRVFDFAQNQLLAHELDGGLLMRPGGAGFLKYIHGNWWQEWVLFASDEGRSISYPARDNRIVFPLAPGDCASGCSLRLEMRTLICPQSVRLELNGKVIASLPCQKGYATYRVNLPAGKATVGENQLHLRFQRYGRRAGKPVGAGMLAIRVVPSSPGDLPPRGERFYLDLPQGAALRIRGDGGRFVVRFYDGKSFRSLVDRPSSVDEVVRLPRTSSSLALLEFRQLGGRWSLRELVVPKTKALTRPSTKPRNAILWVVDTLRADRIRAYDPKTRVKTPNYDKVINEGTMLLGGTSAAGYSLASHATILTGLTPARHRTMSPKSKLSPSEVLLPEVFLKAGYQTAAFLSNGYVSKKWGFDQGWKHFTNFIRERRPSQSSKLVPELMKWIGKNRSKPFFLYVVTIDPHVAYRFREKYTLLYDEKAYKGPLKRFITGYHLASIASGKLKLNARDRRRLIAQYDGEVTYNDHYFGRVMEGLHKLGLDRNTLLVVSSDHGDEMFEHRGVGHAHSLYQELVSVPIFFHLPGFIPPGRRIANDAEHVDLYPTICDLMGLTTPRDVQGHSLAPLIFGTEQWMPMPAFASQGLTAKSVKLGPFKLIVYRDHREELFDLRRDRTEQHNLAGTNPLAHRLLRDVIAFWLPLEKRWHKNSWGTPANQKPVVRSEVRARFSSHP
ncbi:MAG: sulfatase-like hydrolase/transferase, partial [Myxococcales bacterium]|nr:sulfatase-like hydrolase/transferase [Myxococcales bacterium]